MRWSNFGKILVVLFMVCCLCGFSWSLMFGELTWEKVEAEIKASYPDVEQVSVEQAISYLGSEKVVFVDVRELDEYLVSHIPGAVHRDRFDSQTLLPGVMVVTYCSVGLRSAEYVSTIQKKSRIHFVNLKGSLFEWANSGYPLMADGKMVERVHPFNER